MSLFTRTKKKDKKKKKDHDDPNPFTRELTEEELAEGYHRKFVGGSWETIGQYQYDYLLEQGLKPAHRMLDVGCGALRGGIHFVKYLETGNYCGIDINNSLIKAAKDIELVKAGLVAKQPQLLVDSAFEVGRFGKTFHFAIAMSVFTHVPVNAIERCLVNVASVLEPGGRFFATYFEAPAPHHLEPIRHEPGPVITHSDKDPFHYHFSLFPFLVQGLPLDVVNIGKWDPRGLQHMLCFTRR